MNRRRFRILSAALAVFSAAVVLFVAFELFPYHTTNHDEGVYLQQAAMLLEGQLSVYPPVPDSFRPWFFVRDGGRLYPKYAPVPAAMFAVGKLLGGFRLSLAAVAAGNVALTVAVAAEAFDRRTGLLAGAFLLGSPLFLIDSSVFLPYAPTTLWNLLFAFGYLRSARVAASEDASGGNRKYGYAALAGLGVGVAFFSRPYTAVLFALPFVAHALYSLAVGVSRSAGDSRSAADSRARFARLTVVGVSRSARFPRARFVRLSVVAVGGLAGVAVALGYNAAVTGSPWLFPYAAFAPHDGLGFGHRQILNYSRDYTPALALRANAEVVRRLFTEWVVAGPVGTLLAGVGVAAFLRRADLDPSAWSPEFTEAQARAVLAGLFVTVIAGNVYFWGNLNVLGALEDPADGLVDTLGPYYHFDLLVPTAAFAARGALLGFDRVRERVAERDGPVRSRHATAAVALAGLLVLAGSTAAVLAPPVQENAAITDEYEAAYQPFEERDLSDAVVFLPTPFGDWLAHPFQYLRNGPGFDGDVVYAIEDGPDDLAVAAAYPDRTYYRYVYRGEWAPYVGGPVDPALRRVEVVRGDAIHLDAAFGIPRSADRASIRLSTGDSVAYYGVNGTPENLSLGLRVADGTARITGERVRPVGENATVSVDSEDEIVAQVFVSDGAGGGFSYRLELPVRRSNGSVVALSPYREACFVPDNCNGEAAFVADAVPPGVRMATDLTGVRGNGTADGAAENATTANGTTADTTDSR